MNPRDAIAVSFHESLDEPAGLRMRARARVAFKVAHPPMPRAIAAAKRKNDRIDASKIADCLRCDFLPECHMASTEIRDRRRTLRYRELLVKQMVQMKNHVSGE